MANKIWRLWFILIFTIGVVIGGFAGFYLGIITASIIVNDFIETIHIDKAEFNINQTRLESFINNTIIPLAIKEAKIKDLRGEKKDD